LRHTPDLIVDPRPRFGLSPHLFMQFMEPLGTTDGSVEAAWDFRRERWREDVVAVTRQLAPPLIRWGGILSSYYRWREGVGPRHRRKPMHNLMWGGVETNQVGTHEFVGFCRTVGADPLISVNFESDGRRGWSHAPVGGVRSAGPREAAAWVGYCNDADSAARRANGAPEPFAVRLWQIGNETSYGKGGFDCEMAARRTLVFARAMHRADPSIEIIGWGDSGWAPRMIEVAGDHLKYVAMHHFFNSGLEDSPLHGSAWRRDPELTWRHLMHAHVSMEEKLSAARAQVAGSGVCLAMTEGHFALPGRNRCDVLSTWAAGVANARILNVQQRHGDLLKIANLSDFCGTRWMVNSVMIPTPLGAARAYLMPVAWVTALYRRHIGSRAVDVTSVPDGLDVVASWRGRRVFLHVVNTNLAKPVRVRLRAAGERIVSGRAFEIAAEPFQEIDETTPELFAPTERAVPASGLWEVPAASVSAVGLQLDRSASGKGRGR
jgi:alpha-N-arabinofuranosidase